MYDLLKSKTAALRGEAVSLARRLVMTSSPSLHEQSVSATVARAMRQAGLDRVVRDDYGNVAGVLFGLEPGPTVLLLSHMDTVQARPEDRWSHDPLSGRCDDGRIVGLGAADCKGGIAAQLFAAVALKRSILPLRGNVVVAATVAEENGAALGLRALLASTLPDLGLVPEFAILGEPTNLGICYGHEGWAELSVRLLGRDLFQVADAGRGFYQDLVERKAAGRLQNGKQNLLVKEPSFTNERGKPAATLLLTRRLLHGQHLADLMAQTEYGAASAVKEALGV